jgi:hypothetical protein
VAESLPQHPNVEGSSTDTTVGGQRENIAKRRKVAWVKLIESSTFKMAQIMHTIRVH